jgi:hypothetical protein
MKSSNSIRATPGTGEPREAGNRRFGVVSAAALSRPGLEELVRAAIQETGAASRKQMGQVIKAVQTKAAGRAEGKVIGEMVGKLLP